MTTKEIEIIKNIYKAQLSIVFEIYFMLLADRGEEYVKDFIYKYIKKAESVLGEKEFLEIKADILNNEVMRFRNSIVLRELRKTDEQ